MKKAIFGLLFFISLSNFAYGLFYNETFVKYFIWPMAASATSQVPEQCVQDNFKQSELKRRIQVQCDLIKADTCSGFSAVSHSDKAIILSFRGSDGDEIFLEIVDAIFERPVSAFDGRGKVLYYFLTAFSKVWENGMKDDFISLNNTYPDYELWITGHSLGGAMASIAATTIATTNLFDAKKIKLVTFGQPRTGDESYAALVDSLIPYAIRVVHRDDIVPLIPPGFLYGYRHHKSEVWYDNDMSINDTFQECDEDESNQCRDGKFAFDIKDHDKYFDVGVGMAQDGCKGWNPYV